MINRQRIIIPVFCILFAIFVFSQIADAQEPPPSYKFLEVIDYKNEPVADASVRRLNGSIYEEPQIEKGYLLEKTDQKGLLEKGIEFRYGNSEFPFSIDKTGFYPFIDYFELFNLSGGWRSNKDNPIKIELLVIPKNRAEKKAIGSEQRKREFFGAARRGDAFAVRKFIKSGLSPNLTTSDLRGVPAKKDIPIIIFAAKSGSGAAVKEFLSAGINIRRKNDPSRTVLTVYLAAYPYRKKYPETEAEEKETLIKYEDGAEILIEAGADINSGALTLAVERGYARTVKKLVSKGASINARDSNGRNVLQTAIERQQTEIINFLLEKGANPNIIVGENDDYYCTSPLMLAVESKNINLINLLLANKADPNLTCKNGRNALRIALSNRSENFDLLVKSGANVKAVDENGETNLMYAARLEDASALKKMIEAGIPVNDRNKQGSTALMIAVGSGSMYSRLEKVKLLLNAGADAKAVNDKKTTNSYGDFYTCETPLYDISENADLDAIENTPLSIIDLLIANKVNVNFTCQNGQNALLRAIYNGQAKGVKKLLDAGADVKGEKGRAMLDYARKVKIYDFNKSSIEEIIRMLEKAVEK